jgi:hypothetical protein
MNVWNKKIWTGHLIGTSQNENFILIHIPNFLLGFNVIQDDKLIWGIFF